MTIDGRTRYNHKEWFYSKNIKVFFFYYSQRYTHKSSKNAGF